jgi:hypothetical protein
MVRKRKGYLTKLLGTKTGFLDCRDRRKLTFYFLADQRIDFRELVRDLFKTYKTRIWMCAMKPDSSGGSYENEWLPLSLWIISPSSFHSFDTLYSLRIHSTMSLYTSIHMHVDHVITNKTIHYKHKCIFYFEEKMLSTKGMGCMWE